MGLDVYIKGLSSKDLFSGGYIYYCAYRKEIAYAYNTRLGELFKQSIARNLNKREIKEWNKISNEDLDLFLWHSDCDGMFTPKECKRIYNILKKIKLKDKYFSNNHTLWLKMFKFCYLNNVSMIYY